MKMIMRYVMIIIMMCLSLTIPAQTYKFYQTENYHNQLKLNTKTGEVIQVQDDGQTFTVKVAETPSNEKTNRYMLYKTENMWTYILLDKFSGKLWQCQYSVKGLEYIASWAINPIALSFTETNKFTIKPMTSIFQFYLINDETGEMWQFQWSTNDEEGYRWIKKL